jgi:hypothetical protein
MGIPFQASLGLGRQCGGREMAMKWQRRRSLAAAVFKLGEMEKRDAMIVVRTGGVASFYRGGKAVWRRWWPMSKGGGNGHC